MAEESRPHSGIDPVEALRVLLVQYHFFQFPWDERIDAIAAAKILSRFSVWLLDETRNALRNDLHREWHAEIRALHAERAQSGVIANPQRWAELDADGLSAVKFWPAEWLGVGGPPMGAPISRSALTIALVRYRMNRATGRLDYDFRLHQAEKLRSLLTDSIADGERAKR